MNLNQVRRKILNCKKDWRRPEIEQQLMSKQVDGRGTLEMPPKTRVVEGRSMSARLADTSFSHSSFSYLSFSTILIVQVSSEENCLIFWIYFGNAPPNQRTKL